MAFSVDLWSLRSADEQVEGQASAEDLGITKEDAKVKGPVEVDLELSQSGGRYRVRGRLKGRVLAECRRCLGEVDLELEAPVDLMYQAAGEVEDPDSDGLVVNLKKHDLGPGLRDCFLLACPRTPLCKEDCKGLCPQCGVDRNKETCDC